MVLRKRVVAAVLLLAFAVSADEKVAPSIEALLRPYAGPSVKGADTSTLTGKVMAGYQGWFATPGDGTDRGWQHWSGRGGRFEPGNCSIDLWPDMSEYAPDARYDTPFRHRDGSVAQVFSSSDYSTVQRHFEWMRDYGIDGAFCQRFESVTRDATRRRGATLVLGHCREAANRTGRAYAVMYDMNFGKRGIESVKRDWMGLVSKMQITRDPAYLHHKGKPVVALWGFGFSHREWDAAAASAFLDFLKNDPAYGGCTIMLGIPTWFRELKRDCHPDPSILEVMTRADIVSPWTVGRYRDPEGARRHAETMWAGDFAWCAERGLEYLPVVYPGYSFHNADASKALDQIPRLRGEFFRTQVAEAVAHGATMLYTAMFDEIDEGTAIFKCTKDPPEGEFLTFEGLPSDYYLRLTGTAGRLLRGEIREMPESP